VIQEKKKFDFFFHFSFGLRHNNEAFSKNSININLPFSHILSLHRKNDVDIVLSLKHANSQYTTTKTCDSFTLIFLIKLSQKSEYYRLRATQTSLTYSSHRRLLLYYFHLFFPLLVIFLMGSVQLNLKFSLFKSVFIFGCLKFHSASHNAFGFFSVSFFYHVDIHVTLMYWKIRKIFVSSVKFLSYVIQHFLVMLFYIF
jgi:hypothetical protein